MSLVVEQIVTPYHETSRFSLFCGDCRDVMRSLANNSIDAIVTDPPYELTANKNGGTGIASLNLNSPAGRARATTGFMGKAWDGTGVPFMVETWVEALRVLKPGGHLLAFGGSRTYHRLACAIEDAGFEIRDQIQWIYGCLSDDTEILINGRWEPYHKAVKGSLALCYNMDHDTFEWQPVQELFVYQYSDTAYRIESDLTDQIVSRNHRCLVEQRGAYTFRVAEEVARERAARVPILENVSAVLDALSMLDQRTSRSEQDVRASVCDSDDEQAASTLTQAEAALPVVQEGVSAFQRDSVSGREDMRLRLPRSVETVSPIMAGALENHCEPGSRWVDRRIAGVLQGEDERRQQSSVEGRRNLLSETRELQADQVRAMSAGILSDGPQGRIRDGAQIDGGPSDRALSTSPGSGPSRRSRSCQQPVNKLPSIRVEPRSQTVRASRFTRSDLARITPFHYDGVVWCVRVPTGAFVARRNGKVFITGNSGFPKSLDVSKAIDARPGVTRHAEFAAELRQAIIAKGITNSFDVSEIVTGRRTGAVANWLKYQWPEAKWWPALRDALDMDHKWDGVIAEAEREKVGERKSGDPVAWYAQAKRGDGIVDISSPATNAAKQWNGWGTALKPAHEPIVLARKPLIGTVAENVLQHGTGGLNIDGCRVESESRDLIVSNRRNGNNTYGEGLCGSLNAGATELGRWPANVIHDGSDEVLVLFPQTDPSRASMRGTMGESPFSGIDGSGRNPFTDSYRGHSDNGGSAARFFYCAKASQEDRNEGLEGLTPSQAIFAEGTGLRNNGDGTPRNQASTSRNAHPTVKPTDLMRYLCRLITPPGGIVLDPFCGSGSTGKAAMLEGFKFVGIELSADYCQLAQRRIEAVTRQGLLFA